MALDLSFVPRKMTLAAASAADLVVTPAMRKARRKLVDELLAEHPGARLEGDPMQGYIADFPRGELSLRPGFLDWSLHGVEDTAPIHAIVGWFHDRGLVCEDFQDAGFGNRDLKRGEQRTTLESFEELVGAEFLGVRLLREWVAGIATEWNLADGSHALVQFVRFEACRLPDLGPLLTKKVIGVHFETGHFDTLRVFFQDDLEFSLEGAVFQKSIVKRKAAPMA